MLFDELITIYINHKMCNDNKLTNDKNENDNWQYSNNKKRNVQTIVGKTDIILFYLQDLQNKNNGIVIK
jgi:hypothetical protein